MALLGTSFYKMNGVNGFLRRKLMQDVRINRFQLMLEICSVMIMSKRKISYLNGERLDFDEASRLIEVYNESHKGRGNVRLTMDDIFPSDDKAADMIIDSNNIMKNLMRQVRILDMDHERVKDAMDRMSDDCIANPNIGTLVLDMVRAMLAYNLYRMGMLDDDKMEDELVISVPDVEGCLYQLGIRDFVGMFKRVSNYIQI